KRKANPVASSSAGLSTAKKQKSLPTLSSDAQLLLQIVAKTEAPALRRALAASVITATPTDLFAYKKLLGSLVTSSQNPLHCDDEEFMDERSPMMKFPCCGERTREDEADYGNDMCVQERHTTDPIKVEYFIKPTAASKKKKKSTEKPKNYYDRKRKPVAGGSSGSSKIKKQKSQPTLSSDGRLLTRIVSKTQTTTLQQTLLSSITTAPPSDLEALKRILGPLVTSALNPLHCVRCHKSYVEQENNYRSCEIPHLEPDYVDSEPSSDDLDFETDEDDCYGSRRDKGESMKYPCCGERFRERYFGGVDNGEGRACVSTKHTTNPKEVEYYVGPVEWGPTPKNGPIDFG
ncbi:hypothetical protein FRC07_005527, partial [Ceratobasidium sp. 392]